MSFQQIPSSKINWSKKKFPLKVVAENIHSPSNFGMIIRTCEIFGVEELILTGSFSNIDSLKVKKSARAAEKYLDIRVSLNPQDVINDLNENGYQIFCLEISDKSKSLTDFKIDSNNKLALIIGSERHGISKAILNLAPACIHIDQFGNTGSMNVSNALSIALYEITKQLNNK